MSTLTIATGNYGVNRRFKAEDGRPAGFTLDHRPFDNILVAVRQMARTVNFDICEMPITTYLCAKACGKPLTALPVFLTRNFHHWALFCDTKSGVSGPKDLEGRTVGVNRGYTVTTGLWARGILSAEYGVDLDSITWAATDEEHVAEFRAPANVDYSFRGRDMLDMFARGEVVAAIGDIRTDAANIRPLIPDAREAGFAYYRKTGIYPVNHTVVVRDALLAESPDLAPALFKALDASKDAYVASLDTISDPTPADSLAIALRDGLGGDPFRNGVEANRPALEALVKFAAEQHITPVQYCVDELFAVKG
ncbi:MAG: ABC transporter substrate-binding protein [Alphaproteobacteria bacterium]|nr:ABC transporter substrate-binding protein [Alphaproteobacteria bacterium]